MINKQTRRNDLDFLKGISIIAIVLYHVGLFPYGYLAVDTFFVVNGFLIIPNLVTSLSQDVFSFGTWFFKRLFRFFPIVIIASFVCLLLGYIYMIPGDYESLAQSVFASGIFCNNTLAAITTRNYWDTVNEYKPMMHFWYLGVVVQFYFIVPLLLIVFKKLSRRWNLGTAEQMQRAGVILLFVISFILYLWPSINFSDKFYFTPFRIWEFCAGGIIGIYMHKKKIKFPFLIYSLLLILLLICFCCFPKGFSDLDTIRIYGVPLSTSISNMPKSFMLISVVLLSALLVLQKDVFYRNNSLFKTIAFIGRMSLSIFVWHQIILAFLRYSFVDVISLKVFVVFVVILVIVSYLSFRWIEQISLNNKIKQYTAIISLTIVLLISYSIHLHAGVVRDVPELDITLEHPYTNRNTEYIDRIYDYSKPFTSTDKIKVLVVGHSFARDFACVLLEWDKNNLLELSYQYSFKEGIDHRYEECDYLFCFASKDNVPLKVWKTIKKDCQVYGIGTKAFGKSFGRIYARRHESSYYKTTIPIHPLCEKVNNEWRNGWGADHYIDFMKAVRQEDGRIRLFTDENKVISFDCRHLTQNGAKYFANKFNFEKIFKINKY